MASAYNVILLEVKICVNKLKNLSPLLDSKEEVKDKVVFFFLKYSNFIIAEEKKTPGFSRSDKPSGPTGGFARSEAKKEETKESTESGPRKFFSSKKETTDNKPAETTTTEDGWRTTKKPETKATTSDWRTADKPSTSGIQRGPGTGTSGGPPKFTKGPTPTPGEKNETKPSTSTGGFGGWRKGN